MTNRLLLAGLCLALPALAEEAAPCTADSCRSGFELVAPDDAGGYGLLLAAPDSGCRHVRFRIEDAGAVLLGRTPPLAPGELALVRIGRRFTQGSHLLVIAAEGCDARPAAARRVTLAKAGPDHSWRAAEVQARLVVLR